MKQKCISKFLWLFVVFTLTVFSFAFRGDAAEKIQLSFSTIFPQTHLHTTLNQLFADEINKRTDGRVEITVYPVGTLTPPAKTYDAVSKGIADIGMSCPLWVAGRFPMSEIFEMPSDIPSSWVTTKVYADLFEKFPFKEYEDVQVLYLHGPGRNVIATKSTPVLKLEDLNGLKLRTSGATIDLVKAWGAVPRAMAMSEAYEGLSKGVIDGNFAVPEVLKGFKTAEVLKFITIPPVSTSSCQFVAMNKKKWNALPADIKEIFTEVSKEWAEKHAMVWMYYDKTGLEYFKSLSADRQITVITADQRSKWEGPAMAVLEKYISDKEGMGLPAKEYVKYFQERVAYHTANQPSEDQAVQWVEENILKK
jgi:TRAP-type transport system periplasmic protein